MDLAESTGKRIYVANLSGNFAARPTGRINRRTAYQWIWEKFHRITRPSHSIASPNHTPTHCHKEATVNHDQHKRRYLSMYEIAYDSNIHDSPPPKSVPRHSMQLWGQDSSNNQQTIQKPKSFNIEGPNRRGTYSSLLTRSLICDSDESSVVEQTLVCSALWLLLLLLFLDFGSL